VNGSVPAEAVVAVVHVGQFVVVPAGGVVVVAPTGGVVVVVPTGGVVVVPTGGVVVVPVVVVTVPHSAGTLYDWHVELCADAALGAMIASAPTSPTNAAIRFMNPFVSRGPQKQPNLTTGYGYPARPDHSSSQDS
jgi:hypothetical protein